MIDFLKQNKIVIIIGILAIVLIGWNVYNSKEESDVESSTENIVANKENEEKIEEEMIVIHITGEVKKPGVVRVKEGSRIEDIIEAAGGLTENADITNINLAYVVEDGVKIKIPAVGDDELSKESYIIEGMGENFSIAEGNVENHSNSLININTASQTELETLPGIGPSIASRIIEYRNQNGKFKTVNDIKNVTGIGNNKFEKIKEFIKVK